MMTKDKLRQLSGDERLGQMRDSEYLGAEDIDDGTEPILTIAGISTMMTLQPSSLRSRTARRGIRPSKRERPSRVAVSIVPIAGRPSASRLF